MLAYYLESCDTAVCTHLNTAARLAPVGHLFRTTSRPGDGVWGYVLMVILPLVAGKQGIVVALHMGLAWLASVPVYKHLKTPIGRERPYVNHATIHCAMPPLDRYSFLSGHTLHAVSFTAIACRYYPALTWVRVPFAVLMALSRMVPGLHYPTAALVGAGIGAAIALASIRITEMDA